MHVDIYITMSIIIKDNETVTKYKELDKVQEIWAYLQILNVLKTFCNLWGLMTSVFSAVKGKKVKVTLVQVLRLCTGRTVHRGSRGIALLFHDQRH